MSTPRDLFPGLTGGLDKGRKGSSAVSINSNDTRATSKPKSSKTIWTETQWTNLSLQAKNHKLPTLPYFDPATMLLSKEVNVKLWEQLLQLYDYLGPSDALYASPHMLEGGEVQWHSFLKNDKGEIVDVLEKEKKPKDPTEGFDL